MLFGLLLAERPPGRDADHGGREKCGLAPARLGLLVLAAVSLAACGSLNPFGEKEKERLPGERFSVLQLEQALDPDPRIADLSVELPRPQTNADWPQPGGYASHAMHHLSLPADPKAAWEISIGKGSSSERRLLAQPVVAGGRLFTMAADGEVRAFDAKTGAQIWEADVLPKEEEEGELGGGLAYAGGRLFVTTGSAQVLALDAAKGREIWRTSVSAPIRSGPTVANGRVFAVTVSNELHALSVDAGKKLWSHAGIAETAAILGGASPAVERDIVIVPHSSGEIFALRAQNGRPLWSDGLTSVRRSNAAATLSDIRGHPVIDRDWVFAVSHSGRMAAIDIRTGARVWDLDIGALQTPWVAGDYVYVLTTNGLLVCVRRQTGRVRWVVELDRYVDKDDSGDPVIWVGPVLASDRLIVAGSHGEALSVSPYTGEVKGWIKLSDGVLIAPVVADNTLFLLAKDGDLTAMR